MRNLVIKSDANGDYPTWCRVASDFINSRSLAANTVEASTVPALAGKVFFGATGNFYALNNGTAAVPGDVTDGSASELNPACWMVAPGDIISLIAPAACVVTLAYYR